MSQFTSQAQMMAAAGLPFLPLGVNVSPVVSVTTQTLAAMGWGLVPDETTVFVGAVTVSIGPGCAVESEVYFCGIIDGELYNPGSQTNQVTFPGIQAGQEYCG